MGIFTKRKKPTYTEMAFEGKKKSFTRLALGKQKDTNIEKDRSEKMASFRKAIVERKRKEEFTALKRKAFRAKYKPAFSFGRSAIKSGSSLFKTARKFSKSRSTRRARRRSSSPGSITINLGGSSPRRAPVRRKRRRRSRSSGYNLTI